MRIHIKATGIELTPSIKEHIETKLAPLAKYLNHWDQSDSVLLRAEVAKTTNHHHKGDIFYAEANLELPHKTIRIEETHHDLHAAIENLKDRLKAEILKLKEKETAH